LNRQFNVSESFSPYLSVVAASRNDDHGGDPLIRTQIFINTFARQCEKYRLPAELIIIDWNPVPNRPGLAAVLSMPPGVSYCNGRVISVPTAIHCRLKYADKLPFFQMIAKNVGLRRARGNFVLATNIDIIFSDELVQLISRRKLDSKKVYRVDRYDIHNGLSKNLTLDETLEYAWANPIRTNRRYQPEKLVQHLYGKELFKKVCVPAPEFRGKAEDVEVVCEDDIWRVCPERSVSMSHLHTNACGDFMLLSREGWHAIRGYPEFEAFSFNIDSMGLLAAHYAGYKEVSLLPPCVCFHIEHGIGSGWTPEGEQKLFSRLRDAGILNPEWPVLAPLVDEMREQGKSLEFNHAGWGMADFDLPEQTMGDTNVIPPDKLEQLTLQAETRRVSAIQPAFDLDRLTLLYERRLTLEQSLATGQAALSNGGVTITANEDKVVLYIPDSIGHYSEHRSIAYYAQLTHITTVNFRLEKFAHQFPLRFDPCQRPGLVSINAIAVFDLHHNRLVLTLKGHDARKLIISGTAVWAKPARPDLGRWKQLLGTDLNGQQSLYLISTGIDPQLIFPPLPNDIGFPLVISVEMKFIPSD
jgi:hypothetical protein